MENAPRRDEDENTAEYVLDPASYKHLPVNVAKRLAAENGLEVHIIKRDGIFLGDPAGFNLRRLNFTVSDDIVTSVRLG